MHGKRYVVFPKSIRKPISPRNRKSPPLASPSVDSTASFVSGFFYPLVSASRRTGLILESVSNTALNESIVRPSSPIEHENT